MSNFIQEIKRQIHFFDTFAHEEQKLKIEIVHQENEDTVELSTVSICTVSDNEPIYEATMMFYKGLNITEEQKETSLSTRIKEDFIMAGLTMFTNIKNNPNYINEKGV